MAIDLSAYDDEGPEPGTTCRNIRDDHYCGRPASAKPDGYTLCPECRGHWARLAERDARHCKTGTSSAAREVRA